jgi:AmmeMemoRadiSam system protein B/AmmeMemoRadiSam system protein A
MKALFFYLVVSMGLVMMGSAYGQDNIKGARLAGSWYPGNKAELARMLDGFFAGVKDQKGLPSAEDAGVIISPHAGYPFSGPVAAYGFKAVQEKKVSTVIILAPSHHFSFEGASVWAEGAFTTPLGTVAVDQELAARLMAMDKLFSFRRDVFEGVKGRPENSVETQIPFIQKTFPQAKIVPIIMGFPPDLQAIKAVAFALAQVVGDREDVLVDVSVDQSHFHPLSEAKAIDGAGLEAIGKFDIEGLWQGHVDGRMEVDGFHVVTAAMLYAKERGFGRVKVLKHATSADTTGDVSSVVGYASILFYRDPVAAPRKGVLPLTGAQKERLVEIARTALDTFVKTGKAPEFDEKDARLLQEEGAFVTLTKQGDLRGCIGHIIGEGPLFRTVRAMAIAAAGEDPRFRPVTAAELKDIHVEVSVLSKPRSVKSADEIVLGTHGVIVRRGMQGGVFLPQVATETGWTKERFLSELCSQKAGLPPECWKDPATRLEVFTAEVFAEK